MTDIEAENLGAIAGFGLFWKLPVPAVQTM